MIPMVALTLQDEGLQYTKVETKNHSRVVRFLRTLFQEWGATGNELLSLIRGKIKKRWVVQIFGVYCYYPPRSIVAIIPKSKRSNRY